MVLLRLRGSLGNQLFSYCFGRSIAIDKNATLLIDKSPIYRYQAQSYYNLDKYNIKGITFPFDVNRIFSTFEKRKLLKIQRYNTVVDSKLFDEEIVNDIPNHKSIILDGHWQSYKYFEKHWNTLKKELTLKNKYIKSDPQILEKVTKEESVSIHIRRGDYLNANHQYGNSGFNNLTLDHYNEAIKLIEKQIKNPSYFIFSDDISWAKENLKLSNATYINPNVEYPYNDLDLMSKCKHNIIANSTYSWWGGYLNSNENKMVIAPKKWFSDEERNTKLDDLIPGTWIKI